MKERRKQKDKEKKSISALEPENAAKASAVHKLSAADKRAAFVSRDIKSTSVANEGEKAKKKNKIKQGSQIKMSESLNQTMTLSSTSKELAKRNGSPRAKSVNKKEKKSARNGKTNVTDTMSSQVITSTCRGKKRKKVTNTKLRHSE